MEKEIKPATIIQNKKLSAAIGLIVVILIGLITVIVSFFNTTTHQAIGQGYRLDFTQYAIALFKDSEADPIVRVSPRDDYYYQAAFKDHIINQSHFKRKRNYLQELTFLLSMNFGAKTYYWNAEGSNRNWQPTISYAVTSKGKTVTIQRTIPNLPKKVYAIGQTLVYCNGCFIADDQDRIYFSGTALTPQEFDEIQKLPFTPVILGVHQSITGVSKIRIINAQGKELLTIPVYSNQEIFIDQEFHLVELKTIMPVKRTNTVSQTLKLN